MTCYSQPTHCQEPIVQDHYKPSSEIDCKEMLYFQNGINLNIATVETVILGRITRKFSQNITKVYFVQ